MLEILKMYCPTQIFMIKTHLFLITLINTSSQLDMGNNVTKVFITTKAKENI